MTRISDVLDNVGKDAHVVDTHPRNVSDFSTYNLRRTARSHLFAGHRAGMLRILHASNLESTFDGTNQKITFAGADFKQATAAFPAISFDKIQIKPGRSAFKAFYCSLIRLASAAQKIIACVNTAQFII